MLALQGVSFVKIMNIKTSAVKFFSILFSLLPSFVSKSFLRWETAKAPTVIFATAQSDPYWKTISSCASSQKGSDRVDIHFLSSLFFFLPLLFCFNYTCWFKFKPFFLQALFIFETCQKLALTPGSMATGSAAALLYIKEGHAFYVEPGNLKVP